MGLDEKYDDIINEDGPADIGRQKMKLENRAKIFLPFAALKGFEEEIQKRKSEADKNDK